MFIESLARETDFKEHVLLILDGADLNTTTRVLNNKVLRSKVRQIVVPNPGFDVVFKMHCLLEERGWQDIVKVYPETLQEYLINDAVTEYPSSQAFRLTYAGTYSGNVSKNRIPIKEIKTFFGKRLLASGGIFALTVARRYTGGGRSEKAHQELPLILEDNAIRRGRGTMRCLERVPLCRRTGMAPVCLHLRHSCTDDFRNQTSGWKTSWKSGSPHRKSAF